MNKYFLTFENEFFSDNGLRMRNFYCTVLSESLESARIIAEKEFPIGIKEIIPEGNFNFKLFHMGNFKTLK